MSAPACMGGWCLRRAACPRYHAPGGPGQPAERICDPGADGVVDGRALREWRAPVHGPRWVPARYGGRFAQRP